jgi:excinuclease ABC subunit C
MSTRAGSDSQEAPALPAARNFDLRGFLTSLPGEPGVYRMIGASDEVLYVGKARDLRKRVSSYFNRSGKGPRIEQMIQRIARIEFTVTGSEAEALILENNLIKSLTPRYNILFRDDKSYPYLMLSRHAYPRLGFFRGTPDGRQRVFGPYPNSAAVRESIQLLQKVFRLRTCEDAVLANRTRPCLLHQIHRCSAPCTGQVSDADYAHDADNAARLLGGREDDVLSELRESMQAAAEVLDYEAAAIYRDQIQVLTQMQQRQYVDTGSTLDADALSLVRSGALTCLNLVMVRNGRYLGDRSFFPQHAEDHDPAEVILAFMLHHYLANPMPGLLILSQAVEAESLAGLLASQPGKGSPQVLARPQGERRVWLEMAERNATQAIAQRLREYDTQDRRLSALREALSLDEGLARIECFDISHTQGEATVASCVVYDQLGMRPAEYRRYNITGITPGDDYAAMRQALTRRYEKVLRGEGRIPDLLLIDGGRGQVSAAAEVLAEVGIEVPMIGVAKGPERKAGLEELVFADGREPRQLPPDHPGLHLIQQVRDEAHRFAITGHRARRGKARTTSSLEGIPGIGPTRRRRLLEHFGGLRGVENASIDDLLRVEGVSRTLAELIYRHLHS